MTKLSIAEARSRLTQLINRSTFGRERFILTRYGKEVAAIVPIEDLLLLEELEDVLDVEAANAALAESGHRISYEDLRRELGLP